MAQEDPPPLKDLLQGILSRARERIGPAPPAPRPEARPFLADLPLRHTEILRRSKVLFHPGVARELKRLLQELRKPRGEARGLFLWGPAGTGKTLACVWLLTRMRTAAAQARLAAEQAWEAAPAGTRLERPRAPRSSFVGDRELIRRARDSMAGAGAMGPWIETLVSGDLLVLDDLASGNDTPYTAYEAGLLGELIDAAYQAGTLLLVTSNKSLDELARILGPRIPSRLAEACEVKEFQGPDRRLNP